MKTQTAWKVVRPQKNEWFEEGVRMGWYLIQDLRRLLHGPKARFS